MANATGRVVQILGGVVDVEFPREDIPDLFEAIEVERPNKEPMILEVQNHIGENWVRTVAMVPRMVFKEECLPERLATPSLFRLERPHWGAFSMFLVTRSMTRGRLSLTCIIPSTVPLHPFRSSPPVWRSLKLASKSLT